MKIFNEMSFLYLYTLAVSPIRGVADFKERKQKGELNFVPQGLKRGIQCRIRWHCWSTTAHPHLFPQLLASSFCSPRCPCHQDTIGIPLAPAIPIRTASILVNNCSPFIPISSTLSRFPNIHPPLIQCCLHSIHPSGSWTSSHTSPIHSCIHHPL